MDGSVGGHAGEWGRARRLAFYLWAGLLSSLVLLTFFGVTALTIGTWLAGENADTNPVVDLSFFALGAILIGGGLVTQLSRPRRRIAGVQQAAIGLLALGLAGLIGGRVEPLAGSAVLLAAVAVLAVLHPARHLLLRRGRPASRTMALLPLVAALPAAVYAATMLRLARQAGPSCFLGQCAYGDRFAEAAALALAAVTVGLLAASRPPGWRLSGWSAGAAAVVIGGASVAWPRLPGSLGVVAGTAAVVWGVLFVVIAERERRAGGVGRRRGA